MIYVDESKLTKEQLAVLNTMKDAFVPAPQPKVERSNELEEFLEELTSIINNASAVRFIPALEALIKKALAVKAVKAYEGVWPVYNERYLYLDNGVWNFDGVGLSVYYKDFEAVLKAQGRIMEYAK